jgi:hypothetical protein
MQKIVAAVVICLLPLTLFSQKRTVDVDKDNLNAGNFLTVVGGEPFINIKFVRLTEGTPYFSDEWMKGSLVLEKNRQFRGQLKLDLYYNAVHYLDDKQNEFVVDLPVKQITLLDTTTGPYTFLHSSLLPQTSVPFKAQWYLQLYSDSVSLYKYFIKQLSEDKPYNSATYEQKIKTVEVYWTFFKGSPIEFKKLKEAPALFGDKRLALEEFLKKKDDKKQPMDARVIAFVSYLNTLVKN